MRNSGVLSTRKLHSSVATVGSRCSSAIRFLRMLERSNSRSYTAFVVSPVTDAMAAQFVGHLTATALAEYSRNEGFLHQAAYDDLSKHAVAYRQLCLFLRKPAGREAYPSDVFYLHARLLERSCNLGGIGYFGALMSLPVIETLNNDLSAYIATNVISITDGQIYLDLGLFGVGQCPAVSTEKSVSRVGAKSLDELSRGSAFALYGLVGEVRQEAENTQKTDGFAVRYSRYKKFLGWLVQRSSQAKNISTLGNLGLHTGLFDALSTSALGIFLLLVTEFSLTQVGNVKNLADRAYDRGNQSLLELAGNKNPFISSTTTGLRLIIAVAFAVGISIIAISTVAPSLSAQALQTLNSATSFLVDLRRDTKYDAAMSALPIVN